MVMCSMSWLRIGTIGSYQQGNAPLSSIKGVEVTS
jgi:hypothetical protein